jgi:hypothetical protein
MESMGKKKQQHEDYSLYDLFTLGDRIAKDFKDASGRAYKRSGLIMAVDNNHITVLWDTIEGQYASDKDNITFETYKKQEILTKEPQFKFIKKHRNIHH